MLINCNGRCPNRITIWCHKLSQSIEDERSVPRFGREPVKLQSDTKIHTTNGPLTIYVVLCVAHARECRERFPRQRSLNSDPDIMPGSLTSDFLWSWWRGKRSQHSRRMRNPQFYVSDKWPILWLLDLAMGNFMTIIYRWKIYDKLKAWEYQIHLSPEDEWHNQYDWLLCRWCHELVDRLPVRVYVNSLYAIFLRQQSGVKYQTI